MGDRSSIEWTDATWNPVRGCTRVTEACRNCYAEILAARFSKPGMWGEGFAGMVGGDHRWIGKLALIPSQLDLPLRWKKPRRIFVNSMSDLFHEALSDETIDRVFAVMALAPHHIYQVLTKRPARMRAYINEKRRRAPEWVHLPSESGRVLLPYEGGWPTYIWLGTSVHDQPCANDFIPELLRAPAAKHFISYEPALGPLDLTGFFPGLDWVIAGGESGPGARPMHPDWARGVRDQCAAAGVPFFFKQWGEWLPAIEGDDGTKTYLIPADGGDEDRLHDFPSRAIHRFDDCTLWRVGKRAAGALLDGREHREFPA